MGEQEISPLNTLFRDANRNEGSLAFSTINYNNRQGGQQIQYGLGNINNS